MAAKSVYEMVTERIISQLEQGVILWDIYNPLTEKGTYSLISDAL